MSATYHVAVGSFSGPFDLLLQLIARHQVDIYEVSLAAITDDYLAAMAELDALDLEVATEFLIVAATLVELKAARLLPDTDDPELDELATEARDLLYARLLEYRVFSAAAAHLVERLESSTGYVPRQVRLEERYVGLVPQAELGIDAGGLAMLAAAALAAAETSVDLTHVQPVRLTVREAAAMLVDELGRAGGRASFRELTAGCRHRVEVVVHFLAALELYKLDLVDLDQDGSFGALEVSARGDASDRPFALAELARDDPEPAVRS